MLVDDGIFVEDSDDDIGILWLVAADDTGFDNEVIAVLEGIFKDVFPNEWIFLMDVLEILIGILIDVFEVING